MESRKYSTGTKGRLKKHSDECRDFIHAHSPNFSLANEFIESIDPDREDRVWQRFLSPDSIAPELEAWLRGEPAPKQSAGLHPNVQSAATLEAKGQFPKSTQPDNRAL